VGRGAALGRWEAVGAATLRARVVLAARWRSAVALGLLVGIGAGVVIGLVTVARDTSSSLERFAVALGEPDAAVTFCPKGVRASGPDASACFRHDPVAERQALLAQPEVLDAFRVSPTPLAIHTANGWEPAFSWVAHDGPNVFATPRLLAGRRADPSSPDELEVTETFARRYGVRPGSRVEIGAFTWDQFDAGSGLGLAPRLPPRTMTVTGVVRSPADLGAVDEQGPEGLNAEAMFVGPGWVRATGEEAFARFQTSVALRLRPGADPAAVVTAAAPGQDHNIGHGLSSDELGDTRTAVAYEARAAIVAAIVLAVALVVASGPMLVRQARRELSDADPLRALGMTRSTLVVSAVPRWLLSGVVSVLAALGLAAGVRTIGPLGLARRAVPGPGPSWNVAVAVLGGGAVFAFVVVVGLLATARRSRRRRAASAAPVVESPDPWSPSRRARRTVQLALPVAPTVGLALTPGRRARRWLPRTSAVLGLALAVAAAIAAPTLVDSLHHLTAVPDRYGAAWDVLVSDPLGEASSADVARRLGQVDGIEAVAGITGNSGHLGRHDLYVYALSAVPGLPSGIVPTVVRGRAPAAPDEVALGRRSLSASGADLGDTVRLRYLDQEHPLKVVGEVVVNDGHEPLPAVGAVVTPAWLSQVDRASYVDDFAVRFRPEARARGVAALERMFTGWTTRATPPQGIVNLKRISGWPVVLAGLIVAMAAAAFLHFLVLSVRDSRRQLAVLRVLGSSRRQLAGSIGWYAAFLAVPAIVVGVPLGVALGRSGWGVFARSLGVGSRPVVPLAALFLVAVAALAGALVLAVLPAWRASRVGTTDALRAE
jgi:putative ABC transport system permease protein